MPGVSSEAPGSTRSLARIEMGFFASLVALKLVVLAESWHRLQGFDAPWYIEVFDRVHWFAPLPPVRELFLSYHPPLAYLVQRLLFAIYPDSIGTSQMLSTLSMVLSCIVLRRTLRRIGVLHTAAGMTFLYLAMSLPVFVFLGVESAHEALVLFFAVAALDVSVALFWRAPGETWTWRIPVLALTLIAGLLTKFTGALHLAIPFVAIAARRGSHRAKDLIVALCVCVASAAAVAPFYYTRYYAAEGQVFPINVEWIRQDSLRTIRAERDAHPVQFMLHVLRIPSGPFWSTNTPVADSLVQSVWLHIWKRDVMLGSQSPASGLLSNVYLTIFAATTVAGTALLVAGGRHEARGLRDFAWTLFAVATMCVGALAVFGYSYPLWEWRPFKAKYLGVGLLWVPCAAAVLVDALEQRAGSRRRLLTVGVLASVGFFMIVNHLLPVY